MSKQQPQSGLMPRLRFPEFREAGEWKTRQLGQLGDVLMCKRIFADQTNDQGGVPFFKIGTLGGRPDAFIRNELFEEYKSKYNYPRKGEILITCSGTVGKCLSFDGENAYYQDSNIVWIDNPTLEISNEMLLSLLLTIDWGRLNSTTITRIYGSDLRNLSLTFPATPDEQQKIADCLSSLDTLIAAQADKLDALKTHKKGLMQQLFPCDGETVPRLRFPEFREAGEWLVKRLEDVANYENGKAYEKHITEGGRYLVVNSRFISTDGRIQKYSDEQFCIADAGDVLMVLSDLPNGRALAKCFFVEEGDRYAVNQRVCRLTATDIVGKFLFYFLNRNIHLLSFDDGINQTHLSKGAVLDCPINAPEKIKEQERIADFLSSLDALIAAQANKLDALKTHKKGLMQQLFPSPEA